MKAFHECRKDKEPIIIGRNRTFSFPAHWHSDLEIIYVHDGNFELGVDNQLFRMEKGDIIVVNRDYIHYYNGDGNGEVYILIINQKILCEDFLDAPEIVTYIDFQKLKSLKLNKKIDKIFAELLAEGKQNNVYSYVASKGLVLQLLTYLYRYFPNESYSKKHEQNALKFQKLIVYLKENLDSAITLKDAAHYANYSVCHFSRIFQSYTGRTFTAFMNEIRVIAAEELLRDTNETITSIAMKCGFNTIRSFNRTYKHLRGTTPRTLRSS